MRTGTNTAKGRALDGYGPHRIVIPLYIPEQCGYYAESLDVFLFCLRSLRATDTTGAAITVVANGCCQNVITLLREQVAGGTIDQLVENRANRGKTDALIAAARSSYEPFVTFTDADVLFRQGWTEAVFDTLRVFPECIAVSPFPSLMALRHLCSATLWDAFLRRELVEEPVGAGEDLRLMAASVGNPRLFSDADYKSHLCVSRAGHKACIGCTHIVFTVRRREFLRGVPPEPVCTGLGHFDHVSHLDRPPDLLGYWRLSTTNAYISHMGNHLERGVREQVEGLERAGHRLRLVTAAPVELAARKACRHLSRFVPFALRWRLADMFWKRRQRRLESSTR